MARSPICPALVAVLRDCRHEILADWEAASLTLASNRELDHPTLLDHVPAFLDAIAHMVDEVDAGRTAEPPQRIAELHAVGRLGRRFDLEEVVSELALLRDCIVTRLWADHHASEALVDVRVLNHTVDKAVTASITRYTEARDRTLLEFDRIITAAVESHDLAHVLDSLLGLLLDRSTADVHVAAILLREGDVLRVRASVGLALDRELTIRIGEGFAGSIAADQQPRALASAATDPLVMNPALRTAGVRALYGVPLVDGGHSIGVAHMGSLTVSTFARADRELLSAVSTRATAAIFQHMLREEAERTTALLKEREAQLQTLADNIPQLAWMADRSGSIFWYNQRWLDFTGLTLDEAKGAGWRKAQHPDHVDCVVGKLAHAIVTGEIFEDTFPMRGKDGRYRWFLTRAVPIRDPSGEVVRWFGTNTDVTAQRCLSEATKLLGSSLSRDELFAKLAQLAVPDLADWCVVDLPDESGRHQLTVAHADPAKLELVQQWARTHQPSWNEPSSITRVFRTGRPEFIRELSDEHLVRTARDPETLAIGRALGAVSMIAVPLNVRGSTLGVLTLLSAESGRHYQTSDVEVAMELGRRAGVAIDNARLYGDATDAIRLREQILAIVSHDLRNPLAAIDLAASSVLEDPELDPELRKPLEIIERSTARMDRMLGDLLDLARIQSGTLALDQALHDAAELVADSVELNELLAREKGIAVVHELDVRDTLVRCDRQRIEQVFANLISNALKFCKAGDTISVRVTRDGDSVRYVVEDTGPGIANNALRRIFEPYASGREHAKEGLGLGLYISKRIIEAHGGAMWAESGPGKGARFVLTLPIARAALVHSHAPLPG